MITHKRLSFSYVASPDLIEKNDRCALHLHCSKHSYARQ
uniref:Uncharacterized protein n=1 Tax=Anguilla anguilla TaxID=7936 RepID=A0A0E9RPT5_ANGAN